MLLSLYQALDPVPSCTKKKKRKKIYFLNESSQVCVVQKPQNGYRGEEGGAENKKGEESLIFVNMGFLQRLGNSAPPQSLGMETWKLRAQSLK